MTVKTVIKILKQRRFSLDVKINELSYELEQTADNDTREDIEREIDYYSTKLVAYDDMIFEIENIEQNKKAVNK